MVPHTVSVKQPHMDLGDIVRIAASDELRKALWKSASFYEWFRVSGLETVV